MARCLPVERVRRLEAEFMSPDGQGRPVLLFVMGMARSGTSAITRVISLCGGVLPAALAGANPANPRGYWEPRKAIILNERILHRNGSSRFDTTLRLQEPDAFSAVEKTACIAESRGTWRHCHRPPWWLSRIPE
ncbi:hypothetical protein MA6G0125R_3890 [Mycobacteroides abscessus 6G-0125-R]|nr:hypothetical protein MA6G0125R_3890 [Mycobacteroides abscessus 6G-0125-R]EIU89951.1 sulfotransferase family protein [Mycobacteroides abscessus 6G-0212]